MKNYSYDYEWDIEYCYPNSNILKNNLNITNAEDLAIAEREITSIKLAYAKQNIIDGDFDFPHLKKIHKFLFEDIYEWAGELRHVNISKGNQFCLSQNLESYADTVFQTLKNENYLKDCNNIAERLAYYLSEINVLHPFREGNGRSMRIWLDLIFKAELQKVVDWSKIDKEDYLLAMERSPIRDIEIKYILKNALTDEINSREVYMKGIDHSYYYEGYATFKTEEL